MHFRATVSRTRSKTLANSLPCTKPDAFGPSLLFGLLRFDICFFVLFFFLLFILCFILFFVFFCFLLFCFVVLGNGGLGAENCKLQKKQSPVFCSLRICGGKNRFHLRLQFFLPSVSCAAGKCATLWSRPRGARGKISNWSRTSLFPHPPFSLTLLQLMSTAPVGPKPSARG